MRDTTTTRETRSEAACRRRRRADSAPVAVGHQLLHLQRERDLRAIVLADDVGVPLAQAGDASLSALLAESAMWSDFACSSVDPMTLERIQQRYPDIDSSHVAATPIGGAGVQILAIGAGDYASQAGRRAHAGISRICTRTDDGSAFLRDVAPAKAPRIADPRERAHSVRWLLGLR
jgi:hypothetical protein